MKREKSVTLEITSWSKYCCRCTAKRRNSVAVTLYEMRWPIHTKDKCVLLSHASVHREHLTLSHLAQAKWRSERHDAIYNLWMRELRELYNVFICSLLSLNFYRIYVAFASRTNLWWSFGNIPTCRCVGSRCMFGFCALELSAICAWASQPTFVKNHLWISHLLPCII